MNSTEVLRNYRHDISGKFRDITMAIKLLDENSFNHQEGMEIFHAIHEVILKMLKTSRDTIRKNSNQKIDFIVEDSSPDLSLPRMVIEDLVVRLQTNGTDLRYIFYKMENKSHTSQNIEILKALLPLNQGE